MVICFRTVPGSLAVEILKKTNTENSKAKHALFLNAKSKALNIPSVGASLRLSLYVKPL